MKKIIMALLIANSLTFAQVYRFGTRGWAYYNTPGLPSSTQHNYDGYCDDMYYNLSLPEIRFILNEHDYTVISDDVMSYKYYGRKVAIAIVRLDNGRCLKIMSRFSYAKDMYNLERAVFNTNKECVQGTYIEGI